MSEHEKLKWICDEIDLIFIDTKAGSKLENGEIYYRNGFFSYSNKCGVRYLDVREVIFTPEFMGKFDKYYRITKNGPMGFGLLAEMLCKKLDNPVEYLHNLIKDD